MYSLSKKNYLRGAQITKSDNDSYIVVLFKKTPKRITVPLRGGVLIVKDVEDLETSYADFLDNPKHDIIAHFIAKVPNDYVCPVRNQVDIDIQEVIKGLYPTGYQLSYATPYDKSWTYSKQAAVFKVLESVYPLILKTAYKTKEKEGHQAKQELKLTRSDIVKVASSRKYSHYSFREFSVFLAKNFNTAKQESLVPTDQLIMKFGEDKELVNLLSGCNGDWSIVSKTSSQYIFKPSKNFHRADNKKKR